MMRFPQVALNSVELTARRFARLQDRLQKPATERVEQRVAFARMDVSQFMGQETKNSALINLAISPKDLAEMAGKNTYSISRVLGKRENKVVVSIGRQRIILCNPDHLRVIAEGGKKGSG